MLTTMKFKFKAVQVIVFPTETLEIILCVIVFIILIIMKYVQTSMLGDVA